MSISKIEELKIICPFCNFPYTSKMKIELEGGGAYCETCGPEEVTGTLTIICENCKKPVYIKEFRQYDL